jgi:hypothetical protein
MQVGLGLYPRTLKKTFYVEKVSSRSKSDLLISILLKPELHFGVFLSGAGLTDLPLLSWRGRRGWALGSYMSEEHINHIVPRAPGRDDVCLLT